ncbi:hypothetical protein [Hydrogenophaga intermedia]|jgi:transketolase C-terminal domain/subunit|uniref:hypothetical protein n=1 Tax=Hydrogenophaga intermedia TaxID=65786 RepID=UPI002044C1D2|nr:hypothetical protein [Hydrogenophaga intermedia]MCM3564172.1 hypothetical protein [Hydrogenophaga intermedia]
MEHVIQLQIEKLPGDLYLATSRDVQGLLAMGHSVLETLEIARDVARKLLEVQSIDATELQPIPERFDYPLIVAI